MINHHTVTVTTYLDTDDMPDGVRRVESVTFACTAPEDADCRTYPECGCEVFNWNDGDTADVEGHERVQGRSCWLTDWFDNVGAVYSGEDLDDMRDDCVPPVDRSGQIETTFLNEYVEWDWATPESQKSVGAAS